MLIKCPECELNVSDKALACPHCGCPMKQNIKQPASRTNRNKRRRLPNGFGQISEIKGQHLRKPFRVMVTVGKEENGRPICKLLKPDAYFETYNEAYSALVAYNKNPYSLDPAITVQELYKKWTEEYFKTLKSQSSARSIESSWRYCSAVYRMRAKDLRAYHIKGCMEEGRTIIKGVERTTTPNIKGRIKSLFNLMLDYAVEYEIVDRNYARTFDLSDEIISDIKEAKRGHIAFTADEMNKLWENVGNLQYCDLILIQCYSGLRPQEIGLIEMKNVYFDEGYFIGGMKTDAGENRVIPIHPRIRAFVEKYHKEALELGSPYLFNCTDTHTHRSSLMMSYEKYRQRFVKFITRLGINTDHRAHDPRKQFVTMAKKNDVDEYAIKYIVGHSIGDITERVYTEREVNWLIEEMKKIK